uniref:Uncharacterized protein n=1 Tax=Kalanchoe fedtschenkoi TaxID=63787 RepID=A0A7N0VFI8_KALFE
MILIVVLLFSWGVQVKSRTSFSQSMIDRHRSWMVEYNKAYPNETERVKRLQIFQENVKYIDAFNAAGDKPFKLGVNQFTDLTNEERIKRYTGYNPPPRWKASARQLSHENVNIDNMPETWDWREVGAVTPVKNQNCGDCWLYSGVAEVESLHYIKTKKLVVLSEQEILDCDDLPGKGGCQGGWEQEVYEYVRHYGLTTEQDYPNKDKEGTCDKSKKLRNRVAHVSGFVNMPAYISDKDLMKAVLQQPVAVGVDVTSREFGSYKSGVFTGNCTFKLNHAMNIVGFGKVNRELKYWIVRNSWGKGWGDGGYIKLQRGIGLKEGLCGINLTPNYPVA